LSSRLDVNRSQSDWFADLSPWAGTLLLATPAEHYQGYREEYGDYRKTCVSTAWGQVTGCPY
jgi:hypothetical protein